MDPKVEKLNALAEDRLKNLPLPKLREKSLAALTSNLDRAESRYGLIKSVAERYGVDPEELFAKYVIETRGAANPESPGTSSAGASGPFQLMPDIREAFINSKISDPFEREADAAARLMSDIQKRNKFSPDMLSVAYNYGEGNLRDWGGNAVAELPQESVNYVAYSQQLRPELKRRATERRRREMEMGLLEAKASVPAPEYKKQGFIDYMRGEPSPTDVALAEHDRQVKEKQAAVRQRYPEFK
jgi:hypothetical protein